VTNFDEAAWWGDCANTFHEEQKQLVYARHMGLDLDWSGAHPPTIDLGGCSVVDIGGGPVSLLLKCDAAPWTRTVVDPSAWPAWVEARYEAHGITLLQERGEDMGDGEHSRFSAEEVWIYNVLQHVDDPELVVKNALAAARSMVRIFEWIDVPPYPGHPHMLTAHALASWIGSPKFRGGQDVGPYEGVHYGDIDEDGAVGRAFFGAFGV
jgi:hypothetical protein